MLPHPEVDCPRCRGSPTHALGRFIAFPAPRPLEPPRLDPADICRGPAARAVTTMLHGARSAEFAISPSGGLRAIVLGSIGVLIAGAVVLGVAYLIFSWLVVVLYLAAQAVWWGVAAVAGIIVLRALLVVLARQRR